MTPIEIDALESLKRDGRIDQSDLENLQINLNPGVKFNEPRQFGFHASVLRPDSSLVRKFLQNCLVEASFLDEGEIRDSQLDHAIITATKIEQFKIIQSQIQKCQWEASYLKEFQMASASVHGLNIFGSRFLDINFTSAQIENFRIETSGLSHWQMIHKSLLKDIFLRAVHWETMKLLECQVDRFKATASQFQNLDFQQSQLYNIQFENFKMANVKIQNSQISNANFRMRKNQFGIHHDESFQGISIENCSLNDVLFLGNHWQNVKFKNLQMSGVEIKNTHLVNCEIDGNDQFFEKLKTIESR